MPIICTCNGGSPPRSLSGDPLQCCGSSSTPPTCVLPRGVPWTDGESAAVNAARPTEASVQRASRRLTGAAAGPACSPCPSEGHRVWKPPPLIPQRVSSKSSCPATNAPGPNQDQRKRGYPHGNQVRGGPSHGQRPSHTHLLSVNILADGSHLFADLLFVFLGLMQLTVGFLKFRLFLLQWPKCQ